jgi:two-component system sensor histidine kinase AlgZ
MHPILSGRGPAALYFAVWALVGTLLAALLVFANAFPWSTAAVLVFPLVLVYAFVNLSSFYLCRAFPIDRTGIPQLLTVFLFSSFVSSAAWVAAAGGWTWVMQDVLHVTVPMDQAVRLGAAAFGAGVLLFLLVAVIHYVIIALEQARTSERRAYELRLHGQDAELKLLRAQIDPHFLFNSLNSISSLITSAPERARDMTLKLAAFLRESQRLGSRTQIPLQQELALIADFCAIERVRFGPRLLVDINADDASLATLVPPLVLQPLVENAVRHGIAHLVDGGTVLVRAGRLASGLTLSVENPCDPDRPRHKGTGLGLENVRQRLRAVHGFAARVDVEESNAYFRVTLFLPIAEPTS